MRLIGTVRLIATLEEYMCIVEAKIIYWSVAVSVFQVVSFPNYVCVGSTKKPGPVTRKLDYVRDISFQLKSRYLCIGT